MSRLYGRLAAAAVIAVGFPFHLLVSLLIRLGDGGPALYRARRLGRSGVIYELLKYRSMKVGSKPVVTSDYKVVTVENDRRITRIGRILRCGLDELPQLYNVLRAEMAWIGPRPDEPWIIDRLGPVARTRLEIDPGITGLSQVCEGRRLSTAESYAFDVWYVRHRSWQLDLWILMVTPLFIAGFREVGARRSARLRTLPEYIELRRECARELAQGRPDAPASELQTMKAFQ